MSLVLGVIPARFGSTRFPGKPLTKLGPAFDDRTLLAEVWTRANRASAVDKLVIATDDSRIVDAAGSFGADVMLTSPDHPSGSDRVAEVVRTLDENYEVVVNIQGDEPLLTPESLDRLLAPFDEEAPPEMATLWEPFREVDEILDPNNVKVVVNTDDEALYFSRAPIPYRSEGSPIDLRDYRKHQGIYAFRREALLRLTTMPPSALERSEALEQLRALEAGFRIRVLRSDFHSQSIDTPEDLERLNRMLQEAE